MQQTPPKRDGLADKKELTDRANKQVTSGKKFKKFDHKKIPPDALILIIGRRRYGKTTYARYLFSEMWPLYSSVYVFTLTKHK